MAQGDNQVASVKARRSWAFTTKRVDRARYLEKFHTRVNDLSAKRGQEKGANQSSSVKARRYWAFVAKRVSYVRNLTKHFEECQTRVDELSAKKDQVIIHQGVDEITKVETEFANIKKDYNNVQEDIKRMFPTYFSRMKLGERVLNLSDKVKEILDELAVSSLIESTPMRNIVKTRFFSERVQKLITRINDENDPMIGIYGPHGAGKTVIMKFLFHIFEVNTNFKFLIWVTVSKNWTIRKLQDQVLQPLSIKKTVYESDEKVAEKIFRELVGKKYILFLDDVRNQIDLGELGFPRASPENGCKVVLTSINADMAHMGTDFDISVEDYSNENASKMIEGDLAKVRYIGVKDGESSGIYDSFIDMFYFITLPPQLKILAGTINRKDLQRSDLDDIFDNFIYSTYDDEPRLIYSLSYDWLEETKKACLIYCINYPERHKIKKSRVGNYMRAHIHEYTPEESLAKTHEEMNKNFEDLVKSSWLEECDGGGHVTMPTELRDLLLAKEQPGRQWKNMRRLAEPRNPLIAEKQLGRQWKKEILSILPENSERDNSTIVSLLLQGNKNLTSRDNSTIVSVLLQGNKNLTSIPESVFQQVPNLRNLDLSGTSIKFLPDSIARTNKSLRSLYLKDCYFLQGLPDNLGELNSLEILQVSGAWMPHLPHWIYQLKSLKFLKFGYRSIARWWSVPHHMGIGDTKHEIPSESVLKLSRIEVFNVSNFMYNIRLSNESLSNIAKKLGELEQLSSIHFVFRTIGDLKQFIENSNPWKNNLVQKFRFIVGEGKDFFIDVKRHKKYLKYIGGKESGESILPNAILEVLKKSSYFELENHNEIESLSQLGEVETREVRHCVIKGCAKLTQVINEANVFEKLESLTLLNLPKLQTFPSLASLEEVCIRECPSLTKLPLCSSKLKKIKGSRKWWEALTWDKEEHKLQYETLFVEA